MISVEYNMQVYNDYVDFPIAMTNIEDFEFEKLLSHPNPQVREFNFIVITKCTTEGNTTNVQPIIVIYNKNDWDVRNEYIEDIYHNMHLRTACGNRCQRLEFAGDLIKWPCSTQDELINRFNLVSKKLIAKNKIKSKIKSLIRHK